MYRPRVIHGTPITPNRLLDQLRGESFCVSFAAPEQLERVMKIQDKNGMLMLDNGAFSIWRAGKGKVDEKAYFAWANSAQSVCDVAVAVIPDIIEGSEEENWKASGRALEYARFPERCMFVWHMNDSLDQLKRAAMLFNFLAIGSCAEYDVQRKRKACIERLRAASAMLDYVELFYGRRPWVHLMRGLSLLPVAPRFNSADSTNIARNHCRTKGQPENVRKFANRIRGQVAKACVNYAEPLAATSNFERR